MAFLTREQILQPRDLPHETVPVPEWGGEVLVWTVAGTDIDHYEAGLLLKKGGARYENARARLASLCIRDEQGRPLFSEEDVEALGKQSAKALQRVWDVAQRLNGRTEADAEELVKNSKNGRAVALPSA